LPIKQKAIHKMTASAFLVSAGLVLGYLEGLLPVLSFLPGGKLGVANVATLLAFSWLGAGGALLVGLLRCFLGALFGGGVTAFMYSGMGTLLSVAAMALCAKVFPVRVGLVGRSILGAFFFNVGQVFVSILVLQNVYVFLYLPPLSFVSAFTGLLTGILAKRTLTAFANL